MRMLDMGCCLHNDFDINHKGGIQPHPQIATEHEDKMHYFNNPKLPKTLPYLLNLMEMVQFKDDTYYCAKPEQQKVFHLGLKSDNLCIDQIVINELLSREAQNVESFTGYDEDFDPQ